MVDVQPEIQTTTVADGREQTIAIALAQTEADVLVIAEGIGPKGSPGAAGPSGDSGIHAVGDTSTASLDVDAAGLLTATVADPLPLNQIQVNRIDSNPPGTREVQLGSSVDMAGLPINNLGDPVTAQGAATKSYVDVRAATGTNTVFQQASAPQPGDNPSPRAYDLWYQTPDNIPYFYDTSVAPAQWVQVQDGTIADAAASAAAAQANADSAHAAAAAAQSTAETATDNADTAIANAADAQATADGKVRSFFQDVPPVGMVAGDVGDMWFDTNDGNKMYQWDGNAWVLAQDQAIAQAITAASVANTAAGNATVLAGTKITTFYQPDPPTALTTGDLWIDTDNGNLLSRWDGIEWVAAQDTAIAAAAASASAAQVAAADAMTAAEQAQATADGAVNTYYSADPPWPNGEAGHAEDTGDMWYDTDDQQSYRWNDATKNWDVIVNSDVSAALAAAQNAQATADGKITAYYQINTPTIGQIGDLWYDTDDKNRPYYCSSETPLTWTPIRDGTIADAQAAANAGIAAANTAQTSADGKATTFFQTNPPWANGTAGHTLDAGDLWFDTDDSNKLYRWTEPGRTWTLSDDQRIGSTITTVNGKITTFYQSTPPTSTAIGDLWVNTGSANQLYRAASVGATSIAVGGWVSAQDGGISSASAAAAAAQTTANTAQTNANTAIANANTAQSSADAKATTWFQPTAPWPNGTAGHTLDAGDLWFNTADSNKMYSWTEPGKSWALSDDQRIAATVTAASQANTAAGNAQATANARITTFYQSAVPVSYAVGDLWVKTDSGNALYRAASAGASTISAGGWVSVQDAAIASAASSAAAANTAAANAMTAAQAAQATADGAITTYYATTSPWPNGATGHANNAGDMWFNTTTGQAYRWNDTTKNWDVIQDQAIGQALAAAQNAQTTADNKITAWYANTQPWLNGSATHDLDFGDIWYDTSSKNKPYYWTSSRQWTSVQDGTIADAAASASSASAAAAAADAKAVTAGNNANTAIANAATAQSTADGKIQSFFQTTAPTGLVAKDVGDLWFDTGNGNRMSRWSGSAWVLAQDQSISTALNNAAAANTAAGNAQTTANSKITTWYSSTTPSATAVGDLWVDTGHGNALYRATALGTGSWVSIQDTAIAAAANSAAAANTAAQTAQTAAQAAQATADGSVRTWYQSNSPWNANILPDPTMQSSGWVSVTYSAGNATINAAGAYSPNVTAAVPQTVAGRLELFNPTAAAISVTARVNSTGAGLFANGHAGTSTTVNLAAGAATTITSEVTLTGAENGARWYIATGGVNLRITKAYLFVVPVPSQMPSSAYPGSDAALGDMWFDQDDGQAYRWNGSDWQIIEDSSISAAMGAAQNAQTTADNKITAWYATAAPWANGLSTHDLDFGDIWYDTGNKNKPWYWATSRNWVSVQDGTIADAQTLAGTANSTANNALAVANGKTTTFRQSSIPTSLATGDIWYDLAHGNKMYRAASVGANTIAAGKWEIVETDGTPPASSPAPEVIPGIGAFFLRWTPPVNGDPLRFEVHVSDTSGFTPGAATFYSETASYSVTVQHLVPIDPQSGLPKTFAAYVPYYFRIICKDADGAAAASAEVTGTLSKIIGAAIADDTLTAQHINAGSLTGDLFSGSIVLGSTISTGALDDNGNIVGARVELGPDGLSNYAADGHPVVQFPLSEDDDAYVEAHVHMLSADVDDHFTMYGVNNSVAASASILLASGVTAPTTPPTLSQTWDQVQLDVTTKVPSNGGSNTDYNLGTFNLNPSQIKSICWDQVYTSWQVFQELSNGFRLWRFNPDGTFRGTPLNAAVPWVDDYRNMLNVSGCRSGWLDQFSGNWYVWDTVVGGGRWGSVPASWIINTTQDPFLGFDEADQKFMLVQHAAGGTPKTTQVRKFHTVAYVSGNIQPCVSDSVTTLPSGTGANYPVSGCYLGTADFGSARYAKSHTGVTNIQVSTASTIYNGATNYAGWDAPAIPRGMHYDGANFYSVDSTGKLTKYSGWTWPTEPSTTYIGVSAYDSDPTGGTHETPVGTFATTSAKRRAKLTITVPPTQDAGGTDDPDQWRVYWARTSGAVPTGSAMKLVAGLGSPTVSQSVTISADPTGAVPPGGIYGQAGATNTFPAGNPATILDGAGNVMMDAQGHGGVGICGEVRMFAGTTAPVGWMLCQGQTLSTTDSRYAALFGVIGYQFGGSGTSFLLPDMRSRFPLGANPSDGINTAWRVPGGTENNNLIGDSDLVNSRPSRTDHRHDHRGATTQTGSTHTHGIPGQPSGGTTSNPGTASGTVPTNANYVGHAHGGDTTTSGSGHSHTIWNQGVGVNANDDNNLANHALLTLNFIIRL